MALQLNSALICEDYIIKGFLVIYPLLEPRQSLQLVCFPNAEPMTYQWLPGQMTYLHACTRPGTAHCLLRHVVQGVSIHCRHATDRMTIKGNK